MKPIKLADLQNVYLLEMSIRKQNVFLLSPNMKIAICAGKLVGLVDIMDKNAKLWEI